MKNFKIIVIFLTFFFISWDKDPLLKLKEIQSHINDINIKIANNEKELKKLEFATKKINREITGLNREIAEYEKILVQISDFGDKEDDFFYLLLPVFDKRSEERFYEKEELNNIISLASWKIKIKKEQLRKKRERLRKIITSKKNLLNVLKDTLDNLKEEETKQSVIIKNIFASKEKLKEYLNYKNRRGIEIESTMEESVNTNFIKNKGLLSLPVEGKIVVRYGDNNDFSGLSVFSPGMEIETEYGMPVKSIFLGEVEFAGEVDGYGSVVILKHSGNYYSVYGNCSRVLVKKGEFLPTGSVLCLTGHPGYKGKFTLYFELRKGRKPIDPTPWFEEMRK